MIRDSTDQVAGFAKARYTGKTAASNIAHDLSLLGRILNVEKKEVTTFNAGVTVTLASSLVQYIPSAAQGTSGSQRTGDSVKLVRVDGKLLFNYGTGTTNLYGSQVFNYYLVRYRKTSSSSGTTPFGIADFLVQDSGTNYSTLSFPNNDLMENFDVLDSGSITLRPSFATATNNYAYEQVDLSVECSIHQTFTGSAATTIVDNALFFVCVAINPANTGGGSSVQTAWRLWFVDN